MANITAAQQTQILKIVSGLFNAAPGATYLTTFANFIAGGGTMLQLSQALAADATFTTSIMGGKVTAAAQTQQLMTNFGLTYAATPVAGTAAGDAQIWFDAQITAGRGFGDIVNDAVTALNDTAWVTANPLYTTVADTLTNKAAVAEYYSATLATSSTSLTALQAVTAGVTATTFTVTAGVAATTTATLAAAISAGGGSAGTTFTLTTGGDTGAAFTGTAGNDTFNAMVAASWSAGDALNGGAGTDTFNVTSAAAITNPVGATVTGIETVNFVGGATGNIVDTTGWTDLTTLNLTAITANTITAAATTAVAATVTTATGAVTVNGGSTVSVTQTGDIAGTITIGGTTAAAGAVTVNSTTGTANGNTAGAIAVTGGTTVTVTQVAGNAAGAGVTTTSGSVQVTGNAATTAVTVNDTAAATAAAAVVGHVNGVVTIADANATSATAAGTLATVTLGSFATATINSGALATINLSGTGTSLAVTNGALTTPTVTTQALNVNGLTTTGAVTLDNDITTLNLASSTTASTIADLQAAGVTTLNISGDAAFTATIDTLTAVTAVNITNTAGATLGTALAAGVTVTGGAGADSVSLGATTKAITMGAGNDTVTSAGLVGTGGSVDAGAGTGDIIVMTSAQAAVADNDATFNTKFTNFEVLKISNQLAAATTLDVAGINAVSKVVLAAGGANANSQIANLVSGGTVSLTAASTSFNVAVTNATFGAADVLNIGLDKAAAGIVAYGLITAAGVETVNISSADAVSGGSTAAIDTATITAAGATSIVVTGNNGLNALYTGSVAVTNFDASAVIGNGTADTAANLAVTYVSVNTTAANAVTIKGGAGNDTLTGVGNVDTITGGNGADTITSGLASDNIILTETTAAVDIVVSTVGAAYTTAAADRITGFTMGSAGDIFRVDISDSTAITTGIMSAGSGNTAITGDLLITELVVGTGGAMLAGTELVVMTGGTFADNATLKTAITSDGAVSTSDITWQGAVTATNGFLLFYSDGTNGHLVAVNDTATAANLTLETADTTITEIATFVGIATVTAGLLNTVNFTAVA